MLFEVIELLIDLALAFICGSDDGKAKPWKRGAVE
jgi:hypothetical protein